MFRQVEQVPKYHINDTNTTQVMAFNAPCYYLQVRPLMVDNKCQQLVLQALLCHTEVDQGCLCGNLWLVVWVGELGLQIQPELGVHLDLCITNLHDDSLATLGGALAKHRVQHCKVNQQLQWIWIRIFRP